MRKYEEPSWEETPYRSITMDAATKAVADRTGGFSFDFFREAMRLTEGNSAVSPSSMAIALAMVANGDSGNRATMCSASSASTPPQPTCHS